MILFSHFFISWQFLTKKSTTCKKMFLCFPFNSWKYVHFWMLVLKTILIPIKCPFQRYISCRHLNFDPTYNNGCHGDFSPFWKLGILGLVDHFVVWSKFFLEVIGPHKNVKEEFLWTQIFLRDSIYYRAWTKMGF